jgi:hypothetical protein
VFSRLFVRWWCFHGYLSGGGVFTAICQVVMFSRLFVRWWCFHGFLSGGSVFHGYLSDCGVIRAICQVWCFLSLLPGGGVFMAICEVVVFSQLFVRWLCFHSYWSCHRSSAPRLKIRLFSLDFDHFLFSFNTLKGGLHCFTFHVHRYLLLVFLTLLKLKCSLRTVYVSS